MKNFFKEFKTFITRGNVLDMAVGIIIGGAFTAIVTALTTHILTPIINWVLTLIFGDGGMQAVYTFLVTVLDAETGAIDLANSIYINWGAFIGAIINFILVALVLFCIIRAINKVKENSGKLKGGKCKKFTKEEKAELKAAGVDVKDKEAAQAYFAEKEAKAKAEAEEKAKADRLANPTTEDLLKDIKALLEKQAK